MSPARRRPIGPGGRLMMLVVIALVAVGLGTALIDGHFEVFLYGWIAVILLATLALSRGGGRR